MTDTPVVLESATHRDASTDRVVSIDVYRGMVMFLMLAEAMHLHHLAKDYPDATWLEWLRFHTSHVPWEGGSLHDMIQPSFTFLVGVAMPFSIASRIKRGAGHGKLIAHACVRALVLVLLGIWLRSLGHDQTYWTFEDTLTQIGLGYPFAFAVALMPRKFQYAALVAVLAGFWALYAVLPPPPADFDYTSVGVPTDWPHHHDGFASRWNLNSNVSWRVDTWFMNLFPRESPFEFNGGGYSTISFIPTMGTMLLGLLAGNWMREKETFKARFSTLMSAAVVCFLVSLLLMKTNLCPNVKKIWTPTFALYSGGICFAWLAILHWMCDAKRWQRWAFPFIVIGANSIFIYVMSWIAVRPIRQMLYRHLGRGPFEVFGEPLTSSLSGAVVMAILFGMLLWMYRRRVFIKI